MRIPRAVITGVLVTIAMAQASPASAQNGSGYGSHRFRVTLSGASEVPPADMDGRGVARLKVNPASNQFCYKLSVTNIDGNVTAAHIHQAPAGSNGPVVIPLDAPASGPSSGCLTIDRRLAEQITTTPSGFYVNVHSSAYPDGAIRGQLS